MPAAFTAAIWKSYAVPLINPVTVALVVVDAARVNVVQVPDGLVRYWTV